jgi:hypothetical protein
MVKRISKNKKSQKTRSQARKQNRKVSATRSRRRSRKVSTTRSRRRSRKVSNKKKRSSKRSRKVVKKISKRQRRSRRRSRKQKQRGGSTKPWTKDEYKKWSESTTEQEKRNELYRLNAIIPLDATEKDNIDTRISTINGLPYDAGGSSENASYEFPGDGAMEKWAIEAEDKKGGTTQAKSPHTVGDLLELSDTPADHRSKQPRKAPTPPPNLDRANRKRLTQKGDKNVTKSADATVRAKTIASRSVDPQECFNIERDGNSVKVTRV